MKNKNLTLEQRKEKVRKELESKYFGFLKLDLGKILLSPIYQWLWTVNPKYWILLGAKNLRKNWASRD